MNEATTIAAHPNDSAVANAPAAELPVAELLVEELLVEEISIDGMCGVY